MLLFLACLYSKCSGCARFKREFHIVEFTGSRQIWYRWKENHMNNQCGKFRKNIPRNKELTVIGSGQRFSFTLAIPTKNISHFKRDFHIVEFTGSGHI